MRMRITTAKAHMVHDDDELNGMMKENAKSIKEYGETQQGGWIEMET